MERGSIIFIFFIVVLQFVVQTNAFCSKNKKPSFTGDPKVTQITVNKVRLSWKDIIQNQECVDDFFIKYKSFGKFDDTYKTVEKNVREMEIPVDEYVKYEFVIKVRVNYGTMGYSNYVEEDSVHTTFEPSSLRPTSITPSPTPTTEQATEIFSQDEDKIQSFFTHTNCSVTCGPGVKSVITMSCKRSCFPDCCKRTVEEENCQKPKCTQRYGHWTSWTECDKPCITDINERSVKTRFRICLKQGNTVINFPS